MLYDCGALGISTAPKSKSMLDHRQSQTASSLPVSVWCLDECHYQFWLGVMGVMFSRFG